MNMLNGKPCKFHMGSVYCTFSDDHEGPCNLISRDAEAQTNVETLSSYYPKSVKPEEKPALKARMSLLDSDFLMEMAKVMDFGCKKYAEEDWRDNPDVTVKGRLDSLGRHLAKFGSIDHADSDNETDVSHLAHVAVNAMMIWWISENRVGRDNRWNLRMGDQNDKAKG